jgi:lysophospholipase L1-like esterase
VNSPDPSPTRRNGEFAVELVSLALAPLLLAQGAWTRRVTPLLPEAPGDRTGILGAGPELGLLVAGDSAAAGVGAAHQDEALLGQITGRLSDSYRVRWRLEAATGATTAATIERLERSSAERFDVAVTSLGVNDVTSGVRTEVWLQQQKQLRSLLRGRYGVRLLLVSGLPPVREFPALPQPLRWALGRRAERFDRVLRMALAPEPDTRFIGIDFPADTSMMAQDGYHPGPEIYSRWADGVVGAIASATPFQ